MPKTLSYLANRVAQKLRNQALSSPSGTFLGSEADLVERFEVSRPTFRQAAKILEQEQLLIVKTGIGGGYFVRQPDTAAVAHMTEIYLQSRNASVSQILAIFKVLYTLAARAAAARPPDLAARCGLQEFNQQEKMAEGKEINWETHVSRQAHLVDLMAEMSDNPLIKLFFTVTREMLEPYFLDKMVRPGQSELETARQARRKLVEVILEGDSDLAEVIARRYMTQSEQWVLADCAGGRTASFVMS